MDKSEEILKNVEARCVIENKKGQSRPAVYYHEEDVLKALDQALTLGGVGGSLPSKEEISLELKQIAHWDELNGCPKNQKNAYKNGFMHGIEFKRTKTKSDM